jgi:hypothetical protein
MLRPLRTRLHCVSFPSIHPSATERAKKGAKSTLHRWSISATRQHVALAPALGYLQWAKRKMPGGGLSIIPPQGFGLHRLWPLDCFRQVVE